MKTTVVIKEIFKTDNEVINVLCSFYNFEEKNLTHI